MAGSYGRIIYNIYRLYFDFAQDFNVFIVRNIRRKEIKIGFSQSLTFMFFFPFIFVPLTSTLRLRLMRLRVRSSVGRLGGLGGLV